MLNEFRQDLVSGDWVLFSTDRSKGHIKSSGKFYQSKETCPFEDFIKTGQEAPILMYNKGEEISDPDFSKEWTAMVVPNKFPAVKRGSCGPIMETGPFKKFGAYGYHELVITKDHDRVFFHLSIREISEIISAFKNRYIEVSKHECGDYISIFHNFGPKSGGTIFHNHSQILSTPFIPPEVETSIRGAKKYYDKNKKKVHDVLIDWEVKENKRIVGENDKFIAFCPFVSKTPYEVRIFPKKSNHRFELMADEDIPLLAEQLRMVLNKMNAAVGSPDYNFYIHTAPVVRDKPDEYEFYHWHIEIVPKLSMIGGLELGTNVFVNVVDPDSAAESIRNVDFK